MIRRARRDGREATGNEEREKREDSRREQRGDRERGKKIEEKEGPRETLPLLEFLDPTLRCSHCFFKSSGYDKLDLKHQNLFLQAYRMHY